MKKNKLSVLLITVVILVISIIAYCCNKPKINIAENYTNNPKNTNIDYYIYTDISNNLLLLDKNTKEEKIISENVLDFHIGDKTVVYSYKDNNGTQLVLYSLETQESTTINNHYINDYIVHKNLLYTVENSKILEYDLTNLESNELCDVKTEDLIFNYVDDKQLIFSSIINSVPTTQKYTFETNEKSLVSFNSTNIMVHGGYIYGLNKDYNLFRVDSEGNNEVISDFVILKFYINDNFLVYIDEEGKLNTLENNGTNRVISDYVNNFLVKNNCLYYMSRHSNNKIYKTQLTGRHKEVISEIANIEFNFDEF